jgi:hypothetical protein
VGKAVRRDDTGTGISAECVEVNVIYAARRFCYHIGLSPRPWRTWAAGS